MDPGDAAPHRASVARRLSAVGLVRESAATRPVLVQGRREPAVCVLQSIAPPLRYVGARHGYHPVARPSWRSDLFKISGDRRVAAGDRSVVALENTFNASLYSYIAEGPKNA